MPRQKFTLGNDLKLAVIGEEDTVVGFLMAGIGQRDAKGKTNFLIVDSKTSKDAIEEAFHDFTTRPDVGILLINQSVADQIRPAVDSYTAIVPTILEIPSKDKPYDAAKDSVMQRVKMFFGGNLQSF